MLHRIDLNNKKVTSYDLTPRWDNSPPAVGIVVHSKTWQYLPIWSKTVAPAGARLGQLHALVAQFSEDSTKATVADVPETPEGEEPDEEEITDRSWNQDLKFEKPEVITKGVALPTSGAQFIDFIKRHDPSLENASLVVAESTLKKTVVPQNGAEGAGYSKDATQFELVYGEIGNKTPGLKWGEVLIQGVVLHQGTPPPELSEYFPNPYNGGPNYWGPIGVKTITTNKKAYRTPVGAEWLAEEITDEEEEEEEEEQDPANDYVPPLVNTSYQSIVTGLFSSLQEISFEGNVTLVDWDAMPEIGDTIQFLNGEPEWAMMTQTVIQSVDYDPVTQRATLKFGPPSHLRPTQNKDQQESFSSMSDDTKDDEEEEEDNAGNSWETQAEYDTKPKTKMQMPGVGPRSEVIKGSFSPYLDADFAIRIVYGLDNRAEKAQVKRGNVTVVSRGMVRQVGTQEWTDFPMGSTIWCNITVNKNGVVDSVAFSTEKGPVNPYHIEQDENGFPKGGYGPGSYAIEIGTASSPKPIQKQLGPINLVYEIGTFIIENGS